MDVLINAWANVQFLVWRWFSDWWNAVNGATDVIDRLGD